MWCCLFYCAKQLKLLSLWMKFQSVIIQSKAIEQHFPMVLFIMMYKVVSTLESG